MARSTALNEGELRQTALVFAPHPDDETLGLGGTILLKMQSGARVKVVYLTDGSTSHSASISREKMRLIRAREALAACAKLGLAENDVTFLGFPDGRLKDFHNEAVYQVRHLINRLKPQQIFSPYHDEPHPDHTAGNKIVAEALHGARRASALKSPQVFEYPVWFWFHWPWVALRQGRRPDTQTVLRLTLHTLAGARMSALFPRSVDISGVMDQKRAALAEHHSQVTRMVPNTYWPILSDISGGDFLNCLMSEQEIFFQPK